jgi:hypothetical protein
MRTFAGLPGWFASTTKDTLFIHLYDDCTIDATLGDGRKVKVSVKTNWPEPTLTQLHILKGPAGPMTIAMRVPPYATSARVKVARTPVSVGTDWEEATNEQHNVRMVRMTREFQDGDVVLLQLPYDVQHLVADPRVHDDAGQVALRFGPFVYACESTDQTADIDALALDQPKSNGRFGEPDPAGWRPIVVDCLQHDVSKAGALYDQRDATTSRSQATLRPYYAWASRGDSSMRVWMPKADTMNTFADDASFLRGYGGAAILRADGCGPVAVSVTNGRVMTSAFSDAEPGFGLVNRAAFESPARRSTSPTDPWSNYGGEDRLWLSPEGGPHGLFFAPGAKQAPETWVVPWKMDGMEWRQADPAVAVVNSLKFLPRRVDVEDASGSKASVTVYRAIEALSRPAIGQLLGIPLAPGVQVVGFRSTNRLIWGGDAPPDALVGLWTLGQFKPSDKTTVLFPFRGDAGTGADPTSCLKRDYFGVVPDERLKLELPPGPSATGLARFTADSLLRSKIGLSRAGATGWIGAWDEDRGVLTLINHSLPPVGAPVPDCDWRVPNPHAAQGDVATSYNNGGEPAFFELESLSAALPATAGASVEHVSTTIHLGGDREALRDIARAVLHAEL